MNTSFDDVFAMFLSKITTFEEYLTLTEEELNQEFKILLRTSMAKFINKKKDIVIDYNAGTFNRPLSDLEMEIISLGMVSAWITPKINNIEVLKLRLGSRDYTTYSQANHLKELKDLKLQTENDFLYWINRYTLDNFMNGDV